MPAHVWCIIGGEEGRAQTLARALLEAGDSVAIPSDDVVPLATLVHQYWDAVLPIELSGHDADTFERAIEAIEENFDSIDAFAVLLDAAIETTVARTARALTAIRPEVAVLLLVGGQDEDSDRRAEHRTQSVLLEREMRSRTFTDDPKIARRLSVHAFSDYIEAVQK